MGLAIILASCGVLCLALPPFIHNYCTGDEFHACAMCSVYERVGDIQLL